MSSQNTASYRATNTHTLILVGQGQNMSALTMTLTLMLLDEGLERMSRSHKYRLFNTSQTGPTCQRA